MVHFSTGWWFFELISIWETTLWAVVPHKMKRGRRRYLRWVRCPWWDDNFSDWDLYETSFILVTREFIAKFSVMHKILFFTFGKRVFAPHMLTSFHPFEKNRANNSLSVPKISCMGIRSVIFSYFSILESLISETMKMSLLKEKIFTQKGWTVFEAWERLYSLVAKNWLRLMSVKSIHFYTCEQNDATIIIVLSSIGS